MKVYLLRAMKARGRRSMFKFRDDEEDERKTMRYSDSALTGKKTKSFLWEIEIFNRVWKQCMCKSKSCLYIKPFQKRNTAVTYNYVVFK